MNRRAVLSFLFSFIFDVQLLKSRLIYHENTHIMFIGDRVIPNDYFGYSVFLTSDGLYVGAPKADRFRVKRPSGSVFVCSLQNLDVKHVRCTRLGSKIKLKHKFEVHASNSHMRADSWFGSSIAFLTNSILLVTAPRLRSRYSYPNSFKIKQGACYLFASRSSGILEPFAEDGKIDHQIFILDGLRRSYGLLNETVYYYSLGQAGFSMAVSKHNTLLLGAPGFMQFTGGVISYTFSINGNVLSSKLQPIANTYKTIELDTNDYFGYSVDSGIFERSGRLLHIGGAPRADMGRGKVLVFSPPTEVEKPLDIKEELIGPHVGSYFGASLCCTDINNDGLDDLLIGAPTFVKRDAINPSYDQGAVFVYMAKETFSGFVLERTGYLSGSKSVGARFGTAIADLGDIDGDGFIDIAIGAPWELDGVGAVYIYMGNINGLNNNEVQRIQPAGVRGFGWSIARGVDVDQNNCNDLAIGAYNSGASYLYRCIPTMSVRALIRAPEFVNLSYNATSFTAMFCVRSPPTMFRSDIKLIFIGTILTDPEDNRASISGDSQYITTATPGKEICDEKTISVNKAADLLYPLHLVFQLEEDKQMKDDSTTFLLDAARLSEESILKASMPVHIIRDCRNKPFCGSSLHMTLEAMDNPYIPGTNKRFGVILTVHNTEEPAYGVMVIICLPMNPKKIPPECSFHDLTLNCNIPQPFRRNEHIVWEIEMEYNLKIGENISISVTAEVSNKFYSRADLYQKVFINVTPEASFSVTGKPMPNEAILISRNYLAVGGNVSFQHLFEITNVGPSDWQTLIAHIRIPDKTYLTSPIKDCEIVDLGYECMWSVPAKVSYPVAIALQMDLSQEGNFLKRNMIYNATSSMLILLRQTKFELKYMGYEVTTTFTLEPARIIWCIVIPCIFLGLLLLAIIVRILYKCGFFLRKYHILLTEKKNQLFNKNSPVSSHISL